MYYDYLSIWVFLYWRFCVVIHIAGISPGKQLTDITLVNFNFLLIFHLLIPFTIESPIIRAFFFSCLRPLLFDLEGRHISNCNSLSPELLLKLSSIFSKVHIYYVSQNQCHCLFCYFYQFLFI